MSEYYRETDPQKVEPHFLKHMAAMTREGLESKGDIAIELAMRDAEIEKLQKDVVHWREARCSCIEAGDMMKAEIERLRSARNELVTALYDIASHFENTLYAFRDDTEARKKAEGDIAHAMKIAARHNRNGREALGNE